MKYSIVEMEMKADVRLQTMIRRGDIFMAELPKGIGCEQGGRRPVVVIQNDIGNFRSPLVIVASVTGARKKPMPTHVPLGRAQGLSRPSLLLLESIYTIDKTRLLQYIGHLQTDKIFQMDRAIAVSIGLLPLADFEAGRHQQSKTYKSKQSIY